MPTKQCITEALVVSILLHVITIISNIHHAGKSPCLGEMELEAQGFVHLGRIPPYRPFAFIVINSYSVAPGRVTLLVITTAYLSLVSPHPSGIVAWGGFFFHFCPYCCPILDWAPTQLH